jgi:hypothetical protein
MLVIKRREFRRHPGFRVHTVCDARDRHFVHGHTGPDIFPKRSRDFSVQLAHAIGVPTKTQRQDRHAEWIVWIDTCLAKREQLVERNV